MFVDFYKENMGSKDSLDKSNEILVTNTLSKKLVGDDKLIDLDSTDMESKVKDVFVPSLFYTFTYKAENDNIAGIKFSDAIPLILCCSKSQKYVEGLNFNLLPNDVRAAVLDIIDKSFNNYYSGSGLDDCKNGKIAINDTFASILLNEKTRIQFFDLLESKMGVSIKKAFRKYNLSHVSNIRMIEYGNYKYIPLLTFSESIRGAEIFNLQKKVISKDK